MPQTMSTVYFNVREFPIYASTGDVVGLSTERSLIPLQFEGDVGAEITDLGKQYKELHKGSITAGDEVALFNAYLLSELGRFEPTAEQRRVLDYLFNQKGRGNVCNNGVDYNNGDKSLKKPNDSYRSVLWIVEPEDFVLENGIWKAVGGEAKNKIIPDSGYVGRTCDGAYDPYGPPYKTWETREQAEKTWTDAGFSQEFAVKAVSYFYSRNEGAGTAVVGRRYWDDDVGRFYLYADRDPDDGYPLIGRLFASRSPSGARLAPRI